MIYVLDSSFVGTVIIPDEKNPHAEKWMKVSRLPQHNTVL